MDKKKVVLIEGEDASPEAVRPTKELIDSLRLPIKWLTPAVGDEGRAKYGSAFSDEAKQAIDESDATLFGATSGKTFQALFYLRWGKQTYANVRPARWRPGYKSVLAEPDGVDFVIVRENLEDMYLMLEGELDELKPANLHSQILGRPLNELGPGRFAVKVITEAGTRRVVKFALELARKRKQEGRPGKVTCGTKHNMLPRSDGYFREVALDVAESYPDIEFESLIVDNLAHHINAHPHDLDVIVLPNLYGDILSDAAAGLIGGLGLAPSGCYGETYAYFESAHGTAPDIAGKNIINPTATILSAIMMIDYLGFAEQAKRLNQALSKTYSDGKFLTPDQGGTSSTTEFCAVVMDNL